MGKIERMRKRNDVARRMEHTSSIHRNCIRINIHNTERHERKKFDLAWNLAKQGKKFVTEAEFKKSNIRADLVSLDDKKIFEIETNPKDFELRKEKYPEDFEIIMVEV